MKIEKVNDDQIKCILTKEDLAERKLSFSELTFGSEQANDLLRDMMQQASAEYGFEADDKPLMVEIVPMQSGMIIFVITKMSGNDSADDTLIENIEEDAPEKESDVETPGGSVSISISGPMNGDTAPMTPVMQSLQNLFKEMIGRGYEAKAPVKTKPAGSSNGERFFRFKDLDAVLGAADELKNTDCGDSALYKDPENSSYCLILKPEGLDPKAFRAVCLKLADFSDPEKVTPAYASYIREHYRLLLPTDALTSLTQML